MTGALLKLPVTGDQKHLHRYTSFRTNSIGCESCHTIFLDLRFGDAELELSTKTTEEGITVISNFEQATEKSLLFLIDILTLRIQRPDKHTR